MNPHTLNEFARDVAFVALAMNEELQREHEDVLYQIFGGLTDFSAHAGEAGLAFAKACDGCVSDAWIEIVDNFAISVIKCAIEFCHPASPQELARLAREARDGGSAEGGAA
jgi:hypothetical protein